MIEDLKIIDFFHQKDNRGEFKKPFSNILKMIDAKTVRRITDDNGYFANKYKLINKRVIIRIVTDALSKIEKINKKVYPISSIRLLLFFKITKYIRGIK